ncbi:hypothetical protein GGE48_000202 [Rhizobium leguminosarum]|nr:hypothetical protein [Rhizobium leguminosarum]
MQLGRQKAVEACAGWNRDHQFDFQSRPIGNVLLHLFCDFKFGKLVDTLRLAPESLEVERFCPDPIRIVGLQRLDDCRIDVANIPTLEDRTVPRLFAGRAFVDQPGIELAAIGVEPDFVAASESSEAPAAAANNPGLGRCFRQNGPSDPKGIAHIVLVFRSEVHQDGA